MSWTGDLMDGLAALLADGTDWTYNRSGVYTAGQVGIVHSVVPSSPDRVVVLTPYGATDDPTLSDTEVSLQVRVRGTRDPRSAEDLDDAAFNILQNLPRTVMGGVTVAACWRTSSGYIGPDSNGRHERVSNYRLRAHRPSLHRS